MNTTTARWPADARATLGGRYVLSGEARLDDRAALVTALAATGDAGAAIASDGELVLRAYRAWGPACVARLHGDFAFAIRDEPARRWFCARDRFGVRPFFYASFHDQSIFAGTLDAVRSHPRVSDTPYEPALADYLIAGNLLEPDRSCFADVRRLPPAHTLVVDEGRAPRIARYWELPQDEWLRHDRPGDCVEQFMELLARAVADRVAPGKATLFLSGGLDSAAIAACLGGHPGIRALTLGWGRVFADPEPALAAGTADALGLPLDTHEFAGAEPFRDWTSAAGIGPEPEDDFYRANTADSLRLAAAHSAVVLSGRGGDELLARETLLDELRRGAGARAIAGAIAAWAANGRRPALGLRKWLARPGAGSRIPLPRWLDPHWARSLRIEERLRGLAPPDDAAPRAHTRTRLSSPRWIAGFEFADAGFTGQPVEVRYPFMDERVVEFALRLPAQPWCEDKVLLRRSLAKVLPAAITRRRKSVLAGDPFAAWVQAGPRRALEQLTPGPALEGRVDGAAWLETWNTAVAPAQRGLHWWQLARAHALERWLEVCGPARAALRAVA